MKELRRQPIKTQPCACVYCSDRTTASALLYLLLGVWLGPNKALHVALTITLVFAWFQVSRGIPLVGLALFGFFRGLLSRRRQRPH
jgi:hypothetical protein